MNDSCNFNNNQLVKITKTLLFNDLLLQHMCTKPSDNYKAKDVTVCSKKKLSIQSMLV